jgi:hypothetical protein
MRNISFGLSLKGKKYKAVSKIKKQIKITLKIKGNFLLFIF